MQLQVIKLHVVRPMMIMSKVKKKKNEKCKIRQHIAAELSDPFACSAVAQITSTSCINCPCFPWSINGKNLELGSSTVAFPDSPSENEINV